MFLKNENIIFKVRRSKVTDYAALILRRIFSFGNFPIENVSGITSGIPVEVSGKMCFNLKHALLKLP